MNLQEYLMIKQASNTPLMPEPTQYVGNTSKPQIASNQSVPVNKPTDVKGRPRGRTFSKYLGLLGSAGGGTLAYSSPKLLRTMASIRAGIKPLD